MEKQDIYLLNDKLEEECFQNVKNHFEATVNDVLGKSLSPVSILYTGGETSAKFSRNLATDLPLQHIKIIQEGIKDGLIQGKKLGIIKNLLAKNFYTLEDFMNI